MSGLVVGVDYSTYEAKLVALPLDGSIGKVRKQTATFRKPSRSGEDAAIAALGEVRSATMTALLNLGVRLDFSDGRALDSASVVWIERGYGMSRRADWILGAYFAAIYAAVIDFGVLVNPIEAREWKRIVTGIAGIGLVKDGTRGNANAKKEVANEACRGLLALGEIDGSDWTPDELDAFGIAFAARNLNRQALAVT